MLSTIVSFWDWS